MVPGHVYETLEPYAELYEQTFRRPLAPTAAESSSEG
jgi:coenzyme F420 hydrogenase subunit beta